MIRCRWFVLCDHPADGVLFHPILGDVPACSRCAEWIQQRLIIDAERLAACDE